VPPSHIGKYEVQRRLGAGGMGSLYLARDPGLERLVAIKVLKDEYHDDAELRERFIREARSVARLRHENIIIVFDIGEADGLPFMAMEYIAGETLAQVLRHTPTLPLPQRLVMVEELCAGLAHAHGAGIIHRDIKPANLMINAEGVLKILDFGIARLADSGTTQGGMMLGTVNYMSPEQVAGVVVDHRSDIFATGAVLYELITLEQAFPGRIDSGVLNRILHEGPTPIEQRVPGIDRDLAAIVHRALQRAPDDRYRNAFEMGRDVTRVRRRLDETQPAPDPSLTQTITTVGERPRPSPAAKKSDSARQQNVLSPERFAQLQRQQVEEYLRSGEEAFARREHDAALHYGERAAMVDPDSRSAIDLIHRARLAIESKAVKALLAEAQRHLSDGRIDQAAALADEAAAALPNLEGDADLRAEVRQLAEHVAAARDRERRISSSLDRARASIEQGGYETALRAVYEILALDPDRTEARELEQTAIARLQAQREHERIRRQAYDQLSSARALAQEGRYDDALTAISGVEGPSDTVRIAAARAADEVRLLQRRAQVAAVVADARRACDRGEFEQVLTAIDGIRGDDLTPDARALRADAERGLQARIELERKREVVEDGLRAVAALIEQNDLTGAAARLKEVEGIGLADPRIREQRDRVSALVAAAQERRRQEARDRLAGKLVEAARQMLENGDGDAAIALLERDGSSHPLVREALAEIRAAVAEQEERARQEAERRRQEEEARQRAEQEAARKLEEARQAEEERKRAEERRAREAEIARRREEFATLVHAAENALGASDPEQATLLLKRADLVGRVEDSGLAKRAEGVRAEAERLERERNEREAAEQRAREEARRREEEEARNREAAVTTILSRERSEAPEMALTLLRDALTLAPGDRRVEARIKQRNADLERQRLEAELQRQVAEAVSAITAALDRQDLDEAERLILDGERQFAVPPFHDVRRTYESLRRTEARARREAAEAEQRERDRQAREAAEQRAREEDERARLERDEEARQAREAKEAKERDARERKEHPKPDTDEAAEPAAKPVWSRYGAAAAVAALLIGGASWVLWPDAGSDTEPPSPIAGGGSPVNPSPLPSPRGAPPVPVPVPAPSPPPPTSPPERGNAPGPRGGVSTAAGRGRQGNPPETPRPAGETPAERAAREQAEREQQAKEQLVKDQLAKEQLAREQAAKEQAAKELAAKEQAAKEQEARDQAARDQAARDQAVRAAEARERAAIQQLLDQYVAAYNALDERRLRQLVAGFTGIPGRPLIKSVQLRLSNQRIDVSPDLLTATVSATQNFEYVWNRAGADRTGSGQLYWRLRKNGGVWTVVP